VAYLIRSVSTANDRAPHTGAIWGKNVGKIPVAALSPCDADQLERMAAKGEVRVRLKLDSTRNDNTTAFNISGEIKGSEKPDEIVVIGGHIDSWDPGTGALDDAVGVAITAGAASLINKLPVRPKRTIRVVIWGSEETGGSSDAYAAAHKGENIVIAGESDLGSDRVLSVALPGTSARKIPALAKVLKRLKVPVSKDPAKDGGSDIHGLQVAGVPIIAVGQDASRYFDIHHSPNDTLAAVDRTLFNQNVAVWAALVYLVADSNVDFRASP
jgi:Zn-dependent M28 family amino/carboxypeptidase